MLSITLVLLVSLALGGALTYGKAVRKVKTEMRAALAVGQNTARNAIADLDHTTDLDRRLQRAVANFDGDRHLRASLVGGDGRTITTSTLLQSSEPAPDWFYRLLAGPPESVTVPLPPALGDHGGFRIETDARNEVGEVWSDVSLTCAVLAVFCGLILALVHWTLGRALMPLNSLVAAFARVGAGDYGPQMEERGTRELAGLGRGFNRMVARLADAEASNRLLHEQLLAIQDEERADLARDLHDEIGPLLFAIGVDATTTKTFVETGARERILERAAAISDAVAQIQRHVREILGRLRPAVLLDMGLAHAVEALVDFWRRRHPDTAFATQVPREGFGPALDATIYRIVQESLSNAIRHGNPDRIDVTVVREADAVSVTILDDGGGLPPTERRTGFGVPGMQQRARAVGGTLSIRNRTDRRGTMVLARLPLQLASAGESAEPPQAVPA